MTNGRRQSSEISILRSYNCYDFQDFVNEAHSFRCTPAALAIRCRKKRDKRDEKNLWKKNKNILTGLANCKKTIRHLILG